MKGQDVRDLTAVTTYPDMPSSVNILQSFDAPYNERYNYGQRIRGQFVAPMTGDYRFVISCDKQCEFWMSNSPNPEHKERILRQTHITSRHQFERSVFSAFRFEKFECLIVFELMPSKNLFQASLQWKTKSII